MNCCTLPTSMEEEIDSKVLISSSNSNHKATLITKRCETNSVINIITVFFDYILGIHIGAVLGYMSGACIGSLYTHHCMSANYDNWQATGYLMTIPFSFALKGAVIGMVTGILFLTVLVVRQSILEHK